MTQYLLLVHGNVITPTAPAEWEQFFAAARESGLFKGGSELGGRSFLGNATAKPADQIVAYLRFDADDTQQLLDLLAQHPVILHGGSAELCEMSQS